MITYLRLAVCLLLINTGLKAQIIIPIIKANFGVDADLRANYFNGLVQSGNDDWFQLAGTPGTGQFVIDTSGAASIIANYISNPLSRQLPFFRTMRQPQYTVVNNRLLIDAYFVRDYHGDDSTIFAAGSNKNGMSPASWSCPVSQSIPDKNEILDIMMHVRRAGPNVTDSLWLFGGLSIENTTGNRYFDFELYQTDIYYDRATRQFYNYGPDAGHTRWQFDTSHGLQKPGDIILTAEYSSSSLTFIEARIWVDKNDMLLHPNPLDFSWSGSFDGDGNGAQYGYAGIQPKTAGAFYTGLQSVNNTWAGPFQLVLGNNSVLSTYTARQYMEFSVNMSKLGLDDPAIFGGDDCLMPFRRVMVKTRASTSFTSELKDFVAPFDFFLAPRANIDTDFPVICDTGSISNIFVTNPIPTSIYNWTTTNGNIVTSPATGPLIYVNRPGVYIVTQRLQAACAPYATDTIVIESLGDCITLTNTLFDYRGISDDNTINLSWKAIENQFAKEFIIERSIDGINFSAIHHVEAGSLPGEKSYSYTDTQAPSSAEYLFYRVRFTQLNGNDLISGTLRFKASGTNNISVLPNPVQEYLQLNISTDKKGVADFTIISSQGQTVLKKSISLIEGGNSAAVNIPAGLAPGIYLAVIKKDGEIFKQKIIIQR